MSGIQTCVGCMSPYGHKPTLLNLFPLLQFLHTHSKAVCLYEMEDYYHHCADSVKPHVVPKSLLYLHDPRKDGCKLSVLFQHCESLTHVVAVTETQTATVEAEIRQQHQSHTLKRVLWLCSVDTERLCWGFDFTRCGLLDNTSDKGTGVLLPEFRAYYYTWAASTLYHLTRLLPTHTRRPWKDRIGWGEALQVWSKASSKERKELVVFEMIRMNDEGYKIKGHWGGGSWTGQCALLAEISAWWTCGKSQKYMGKA